MTNPLDDLRRQGMMTAEVEAYDALFVALRARLLDPTPGAVALSDLSLIAKTGHAALTSLAAALVEMKGEGELAESFVAQLKHNLAHEDEKKRERESRQCATCHFEQEGIPTSCAACVAVFPDETSQEYDHPPLDFACSRWQPKDYGDDHDRDHEKETP